MSAARLPCERSYLVSAPGKAIIFGEHAVVYGKSAIAASIDLRTTATIRPISDFITLSLPDLDFVFKWSVLLFNEIPHATLLPLKIQHDSLNMMMSMLPATCSEVVKQSASAFLTLYTQICHVRSGFHLDVTSALPIGAGLGSSASFSVCVASLLLLFSGTIQMPITATDQFSSHDLNLINNWAFISEKVIHGNPSGVDNSLCTFGGARVYTKLEGIQELKGFPQLEFILTNTTVPKSTKHEVEKVRLRREKFPYIVNSLLDSIQAISDCCTSACLKNDQNTITLLDLIEQFEVLVDMNQSILVGLGVSHPKLELIRLITSQHGHRSKLTGAGGGGCALTIIRPGTTEKDISTLCDALECEGFQCFRAQVGCKGVQACLIE
ncbi:hypothetical protein BDV3_004245 [Batrachochytrium dendrobatidis]|uniref:Mevalonate kinase n=2 Tax=Batrachochytrium dendrobatidis (strain JEL423) TaxID=403673 RepID=A0A177WGA7_BATDL|nr:mevalonate kinase [Batrachochytrium dendrobatidis JEL423]